MHANFIIRPRQGQINMVWDFADILRASCSGLLAQVGENKVLKSLQETYILK
jgi:hypothetical protein